MVREIQSTTARITLYEDPYSKRIRVDDYAGAINEVVALIDQSVQSWVEKLIVKSRPADVSAFENEGYGREAVVKKYFSGTDMYFLTRYLTAIRRLNANLTEEERLISEIINSPVKGQYHPDTACSYATLDDARALADFYKEAFLIYPTPVGDPDHIRKTIQEGTLYVMIREDGTITSAASAEVNRKYSNAELTDCATTPASRGKGHMRILLGELEKNLKGQGIGCLYTIARSASHGMNKVFHQLGYTYGGRMTNNCMIYSGLEDMNVWYKS